MNLKHSKEELAKIRRVFGESGQKDWVPENAVVPSKDSDAVPEPFANFLEEDGQIEIGEGCVWKHGIKYE